MGHKDAIERATSFHPMLGWFLTQLIHWYDGHVGSMRYVFLKPSKGSVLHRFSRLVGKAAAWTGWFMAGAAFVYTGQQPEGVTDWPSLIFGIAMFFYWILAPVFCWGGKCDPTDSGSLSQ